MVLPAKVTSRREVSLTTVCACTAFKAFAFAMLRSSLMLFQDIPYVSPFLFLTLFLHPPPRLPYNFLSLLLSKRVSRKQATDKNTDTKLVQVAAVVAVAERFADILKGVC